RQRRWINPPKLGAERRLRMHDRCAHRFDGKVRLVWRSRARRSLDPPQAANSNRDPGVSVHPNNSWLRHQRQTTSCAPVCGSDQEVAGRVVETGGKEEVILGRAT
ncbi:MAG: hypothetical protein M3O46_15155, partial [Myxococcota bacterium]|nr:hypothetical protein [Myxococcota bacterium]